MKKIFLTIAALCFMGLAGCSESTLTAPQEVNLGSEKDLKIDTGNESRPMPVLPGKKDSDITKQEIYDFNAISD